MKMAFMQFADNTGTDAQADQCLCCPLTESVDTVVYVDQLMMLRSDCTDAHADLGLLFLQIA